MPNIPDDWISPAQAATALKLTKGRVYQFCARGQLKAVKVGSSWMIDPDSVAKFAAAPRPQGWRLGRKRKPAGE